MYSHKRRSFNLTWRNCTPTNLLIWIQSEHSVLQCRVSSLLKTRDSERQYIFFPRSFRAFQSLNESPPSDMQQRKKKGFLEATLPQATVQRVCFMSTLRSLRSRNPRREYKAGGTLLPLFFCIAGNFCWSSQESEDMQTHHFKPLCGIKWQKQQQTFNLRPFSGPQRAFLFSFGFFLSLLDLHRVMSKGRVSQDYKLRRLSNHYGYSFL